MVIPADGASFRKASTAPRSPAEQFAQEIQMVKQKRFTGGLSREGQQHQPASATVSHNHQASPRIARFHGTEDSEHITIHKVSDGRYMVQIAGLEPRYFETDDPYMQIGIDARGGNDVIKASPEVDLALVINGGEGDDKIHGGQHGDYINGGGGDDQLFGGNGNDILYGLSGRDTISGDNGADYLDGNAGNDDVNGNGGNDIVIGGVDNDRIQGGGGIDTMITLTGKDTVIDSRSDSGIIYAKKGDTLKVSSGAKVHTLKPWPDHVPLGDSVGVYRSSFDDDYQERVLADIELLKFLPRGQLMLALLDSSGHRTTVRDWDADFVEPSDEFGAVTFGFGSDATIAHRPSQRRLYDLPDTPENAWNDVPPSLWLYHQLSHAKDMAFGLLPTTYSDNPGSPGNPLVYSKELDAIGLPNDRNGDGTVEPPLFETTENGLREDLGLPLRPYA
jgi:hypothetical protein